MVITITMKNVRLRNGIYEFRMRVPKDCQEDVGLTEITQSLQTDDPARAAVKADEIAAEWKAKFNEFRLDKSAPPVTKAKTSDTVADFKKQLADHMAEHLDDLLVQKTKDQLVEWCRSITNDIVIIHDDRGGKIPLNDELGLEYPLPPQKSPGMTRRMNKAIVDALEPLKHDRGLYYFSSPTRISGCRGGRGLGWSEDGWRRDFRL